MAAHKQAKEKKTSDTQAKAKVSRKKTWTSGQMIRKGTKPGQEPRKDTGSYRADQWVGEGQGTGSQAAEEGAWTSGQMIREGTKADQEPRKDTGSYQADQWVGEAPQQPKADEQQ